ncbi:hypothetical protein LYSHEL_29040 [Lysobacter helvus]|uniref:DUF1778 domain-containing protein n=2 Tax=Lysobacteraceae TaxID=32033 RepID=A0ABM7Q954_9GAMM|nr:MULTISPECIES: hypothetical protein [Lysobacter]BCT93877.1 hypothetical protein LYSCAS_29010 [Lysobacter caseinilyticus]BCT97033.1 hypothetical protein LYSHEL_29040 [Lysobacter helvus]
MPTQSSAPRRKRGLSPLGKLVIRGVAHKLRFELQSGSTRAELKAATEEAVEALMHLSNPHRGRSSERINAVISHFRTRRMIGRPITYTAAARYHLASEALLKLRSAASEAELVTFDDLQEFLRLAREIPKHTVDKLAKRARARAVKLKI